MNMVFMCLVEGCKVRIPVVSGDVQMLIVQTHIKDANGVLQVPLEHHGAGETGPKAQKLRTLYPRGQLAGPVSLLHWEKYKEFYKLTIKEEIYSHMRSCCSDLCNISCTRPLGELLKPQQRVSCLGRLRGSLS